MSCSCSGLSQDWLLDLEEDVEFLEGPQEMKLLAALMYADSKPSVCALHLGRLVQKFGLLPELDDAEN